jgi:hypothetical protein
LMDLADPTTQIADALQRARTMAAAPIRGR